MLSVHRREPRTGRHASDELGPQLEIGCRSDRMHLLRALGQGRAPVRWATPGKAQLFAGIRLAARQGCRRLQRNSYPMTLMDCKVANKGAYDATRRIREIEDGAGKRTRAITANAMASDRESCRAADMGDRVKVSNRAPRSLDVIARSTKPMYCGPSTSEMY